MLPTPPDGLRHWRAEDAPALEAAWSDPEVLRWSPPPAERPAAAVWIAGAEERWRRRLALDLVIEPLGDERADRRARVHVPHERADPHVGGEVGLRAFTSDPARAELGLWVAADHRGGGLGVRAVGAVSAWALHDEGLALHQLWARTDPGNVVAERVFDRAGWDRLGETAGKTIWSATRSLLR